jgi:enamine deaminase RidA (YjgF/YER057c/UK114 family)
VTIKRIQKGRTLSQAVVHGGVVYVAGQVSPVEAKETTVSGQTRHVLSRIDALLAEAGTSKHRLL